MPEKEVFMTEIMRKDTNLNTMEGRDFTELQTMSATKDNLLEFRGRKYVIGQGRMGKQETKTENENYYLLTLAAIAMELRERTEAKTVKVNLAVGVPLTLYGKEKKEFKNYLRAIDRIQKECIAKYGKEVPEYIINEVIETGDTKAIAKNKESIMDTINAGLKRYALEVEAKLRELKIDFDFTNVVYVGGGAGVMRCFGSCTGENVRYVTDVHANALGYQYLAQNLEV